MRQHHIGDVVVHAGEPPKSDPFFTPSLVGQERVEALTALYLGKDTSRWTYWYAPFSGIARRLAGRDEVNWQTSGLPRLGMEG